MLACAHCGQVLCGKDERYIDHLALVAGKPAEAGLLICTDPGYYIDEAVGFRQYCCPNCMTVFLAELVPTASSTTRLKHLD
jgi:N-methylhydantoinase B